ncbi:MAG: LysR family transcriptional regulator [Pantoea sp. Pent]|nr:LysR family transcriptional regulator [Pantoea sp. Pent]
MDIKILRAFATVAALEHIGQAAERLHISPSPLSRQIQQLESELGMVLFHREKKRLRLTDKGKRFLTEVTPFLQHHERLKDYAQHLQQGDVGRLDIGYVEAAIHSRLLPAALARLAPGAGIDVRLHALRSAQQIARLEAGAIDIAIVHTLPHDDADFVHKKIATEPVLLAACQRAGFQPDIRFEVNGPLAALACVEAGLGFTLIQHSLARIVSDNVILLPVPELALEIVLYAVWRRQDTRPLTARFLLQLCLTPAVAPR